MERGGKTAAEEEFNARLLRFGFLVVVSGFLELQRVERSKVTTRLKRIDSEETA